MAHPGPLELGRGVVVGPGAPVPSGWESCPRVLVDAAGVADPAPVVAELHRAWLLRRPVVVELAADPAELRSPEQYGGAVYDLRPEFEFTRERLQFLVWANSYDARSGDPVWWHGRRASRRFAGDGVAEGGPADLLLADGTPVYVDGGPPDPPPLPGGAPGVVHRWSAEAGRLTVARDDATTADLAADQRGAVDHRSGPARVIAPAGSGKTRVLTERLRHLVADRGTPPGSVSAVAYNARAAAELRDRCGPLVTPDGPAIRTLNGTGLWICNRFGGTGRLRVLEEPGVRDLVQRLFGVRRQANTDTVAPYVEALSAVRLGLAPPERVEAAFPDAAGLAEGFDRYRAELAALGAVDFDEQIYRAIEILVTDAGARVAAQARCRRVLVDEFQDLTPAHLLLIRLLSAPGYDCFGVGDDDQVIYGYAGATPEFLIDFPTYFPGVTGYALEVNYRCPAPVVAAASSLLSYNRRRLAKTIRPHRQGDIGLRDDGSPPALPVPGAVPPAGGAVVVRTAPADELAGVAVAVIEGWIASGVGPEDIAVLARVNAALLPVQVACSESGLPCTAPLGAAVLARTGIRAALAYLRIGSDPGRIDVADVRDTIRRPSRGIAPMVADMVTKGRSTSVAEIRRLAGRLTGRDAPKLAAYADDLEAVAASCGRSTAAALDTIRTGIGLDETLEALDSSRREVDRSTHRDDLVALASVASLHPEASTFEQWLRAVLSRPPASPPAVELSTVHRIKGKEWGHVVVFGASRGLFPHRLAGDDEEEERRVFHVAVTRARTQVVVVGDAGAPSPFLAELDGSGPRPDPGTGPSGTRRRRIDPSGSGQPGPPGQPGQTDAVPRGGGRPSAPAPDAVERSLRAWRSAVARRERVPAYVVLNDQELTGIATRAPGTLAELAGCRGMGPIRLERWGDEILAVIGEAATGSG